ncbi:Fic family protein [Pseudomonas tolaasii]|uniref:Fic family protein n=1 Tax=Pseudomonas tolaasii TaxID=29442 RepID=UPI001C52F5F6|nr:Fic family protein [Pseudomonas tolaasii]QXQ20330.1 Fic family protein [Pseudomonas tolaasii]
MALTPFIPQDKAPGRLQDDVVELMQLDAALNANIPQPLRLPMINLLRQVNSFYSNKIEGNPTLPAEVLRAQEIPPDEKTAENLLEIKRHIDAQRRLSNDPIDEVAICTRESIARMHREFYVGMPEEHMHIKVNDEGDTVPLVPGEFRTRGVQVGKHIPPSAEEMGSYLNWFERAYRLDWLHGMTPILAAAGAHHRLMWIHPFMDGNGRTGRLFTDQYLRAAGLGGYGLWTISRGFGRDVDAYYAALIAADHVRKGDLDGRGELSDGGLLKFTEYFIATALEQVRYFSSLLEPRMLSQRIDYYFEMRKRGAFPAANGVELPTLRIEARDVYRDLLYHGPMQRSEIQAKLDMSERTTRNLLSQMADEGLINLDGRKPVSLKLSRHSIEFLFPTLF